MTFLEKMRCFFSIFPVILVSKPMKMAKTDFPAKVQMPPFPAVITSKSIGKNIKKGLPHYVEAAQLNAFLRGITYPQRMHKKSTFSIKVPQIHLQKPLKMARRQRFPKFCFLVLNRYRQVLQGITCCITDTEFVIKHKCG